jgi:hypothetical protein
MQAVHGLVKVCSDMARPKSPDPREHLPLRIRRSARQWWEEQARQKGMDGAPQLVQQVLEERAGRGDREAESVAGPELTKLPRPHSDKPLARETVTPRFKKGGK